MIQSHSTSPSSLSRSESVTFLYEQTLSELDNLQKEFQRMEVNRRQKVNSMKLKRNQQLLTEYKIKLKDEHIKHVRQRRTSLENHKTREKLNKSAKNQRKRESRLKLLETVGSNALKYGHLFTAQQKQTQKRRETVLQRRQELERQKDQKKKEEFMQKQKQRDKQIARAINNKRKAPMRPKSASNSFCLYDNKHNNHNNHNNHHHSTNNIQHFSLSHSFSSFDEYRDKNHINYDSESDLSLIFDQKQTQKQKQMLRSKSAKTLRSSSRASSLDCTSDDLITRKKGNQAFKYKHHEPSSTKNKKKKYYGFMKPTLSAYLVTNNPTKLFAAC